MYYAAVLADVASRRALEEPGGYLRLRCSVFRPRLRPHTQIGGRAPGCGHSLRRARPRLLRYHVRPSSRLRTLQRYSSRWEASVRGHIAWLRFDMPPRRDTMRLPRDYVSGHSLSGGGAGRSLSSTPESQDSLVKAGVARADALRDAPASRSGLISGRARAHKLYQDPALAPTVAQLPAGLGPDRRSCDEDELALELTAVLVAQEVGAIHTTRAWLAFWPAVERSVDRLTQAITSKLTTPGTGRLELRTTDTRSRRTGPERN
ncbi:hypothetical protein C8Q77DRAFT_511189 [Trametes polyzona]|nr:hypothetical protein C8Q77DRAFT_511189 [Trametes polyzona]